ncbi:MAG: sulfatase-like hydrolase/transferase [Chitinivibrionales bacterium]|nr:sulfatase-like hydrolase/transferase [Chitinivibrionales bacterium]MBD3357740.1 sulfatase-like hydrolase/transferase [Chitinivibrionales bacterium]
MAERPNFVFIMTDTQGSDHVGAYGHGYLQTTNLDRLASQGTLFEHAFTTCPLCTPARAAIFSGIYSSKSGPWANSLAFAQNVRSMGQIFSDAGYHTAYVGKWHLDGHDYFGDGRCPEGWDERYWYDGRRFYEEFDPERRKDFRQVWGIEGMRKLGITAEDTWAYRNTERAMRFLSEAKEESSPFCLVVSHDEPHHPYICPPEYMERFEHIPYENGPAAHDTLEGKPSHQIEWAKSKFGCYGEVREKVLAPWYLGCNAFVDEQIGRLIDAVDRMCPDNTYIIYTSDHGDMHWAHRLSSKGPVIYDAITRIPLIMKGPNVPAGWRSQTNVSHADLLPTMLSWAGVEVPPAMDGESLCDLMARRADQARSVVVEFNRFEISMDAYGGFMPMRAIIRDDYTLALNLLTEDELYQRIDDPNQLHNLLGNGAHNRVRAELHDELLAWMEEHRDPFRGSGWEQRRWRTTNRTPWLGAFRPAPPDGHAPAFLDYDTARPTRGTHMQFE